jgi:hypothetical protein
VTDDQRTIIITADLADVAGSMTLDIGALAPHIACAILRACADDLERYEPSVTVIHEDEPLWGYTTEDAFDED